MLIAIIYCVYERLIMHKPKIQFLIRNKLKNHLKIIFHFFCTISKQDRINFTLTLMCRSILSLFRHSRSGVASIPLWERSSLPKHSNDWQAYNGNLICVPCRMQHARTASCTRIRPSNQSSRPMAAAQQILLHGKRSCLIFYSVVIIYDYLYTFRGTCWYSGRDVKVFMVDSKKSSTGCMFHFSY